MSVRHNLCFEHYLQKNTISEGQYTLYVGMARMRSLCNT